MKSTRFDLQKLQFHLVQAKELHFLFPVIKSYKNLKLQTYAYSLTDYKRQKMFLMLLRQNWQILSYTSVIYFKL